MSAVKKGDLFDWMGFRVEVTRASKTWADIKVTPPNGTPGWTKRQPLPFPVSFSRFIVCAHARPKTYYARQGSTVIASNDAASTTGSNGVTPITFYGALCDQCARDVGLNPTAFGRDLDPTLVRKAAAS